jgi:tetratricopeptide (TPR) repeat protein
MKSTSALFRLCPLAIAVSFLGACSTQPPPPPVVTAPTKPAAATVKQQSRFHGTLADLEGREVVIEKSEVKKASAEDALNNYQTALTLFQDPSARLDTLKRMAQLTMQASTKAQEKAIDTGTPLPVNQPVDDQSQADSSSALFQQVMQGKSAATRAPLPAATPAAKVSYANAIRLYREVLQSSFNANERADAYYELAKAYDLNGQRKECVQTLRNLVKEYPGNPYFVEAEFRIGEDAFSSNHFMEAADHYSRVVKAQDNGDFHDQALYKQGWSLYRAADYDNALPVFFQVTEELRKKLDDPRLDKGRYSNINKLVSDTYRIISLSFIQMDGAKSTQAYFAKVGPKDYEPDVYMNLGQTYLDKRMFRNAANTFDTFVAQHPMHPRAPEFSSATIRAYQDGGFPTEVIPAKENFIKHYGPASAFWAQANTKTRENIRPLLLGHLIDLAKYWHAQAQQSGKEEDYMKAASLYRQHLALQPPENEAITINELLAEALYSAKHFGEAITEFEKTAYDYKNPKAVEAAYFGLISFHEETKIFKGTPAEDKAWFDRRVTSTLKFAEHFPGDQRTPPVLEDLTNDQLARKDLPGALKTANVIVVLTPPAPEKVQLEAWEVIGDGNFDLVKPDQAEMAYHRVLGFAILDPNDRPKYQNRLAASIYKQAEILRDKNDIDGAVANYMRVGSAGGDPKLVISAQFDAATLLLNNKRYAQAIPILEDFRRKYPDNTLSATIPDKLALAYEETKQYDKAAHEYEGISRTNLKTDVELSRQAEAKAAELFTKAGMTSEAMRIYTDYVANFPRPINPYVEAQFKLYNYSLEQKNQAESDRWLLSLATTYDKAGGDNTNRTTWLGAMAHYTLDQPFYDQFATIPLTQPLKKSLFAKKQAMQKALDAYQKTAAIGVAEFTTASNYQIAEIYRKLATDLRESERPKGLNQDELDQYAELLDEQATPFEDKSITIYIANANLVKQNIYDESVRKSFDALAKLSPGRYNKHEQPETFVDVIY